MKELEVEINENMAKIWIPASVGVVDETLVAHKGRKNLYYAKTQAPCLKNWSLVDFTGYFVSFSMFRRDRSGLKKTSEAYETLVRVAKPLLPDLWLCRFVLSIQNHKKKDQGQVCFLFALLFQRSPNNLEMPSLWTNMQILQHYNHGKAKTNYPSSVLPNPIFFSFCMKELCASEIR